MELPLILDGATGTMLQAYGMPEGVCPEAWILEHPETILDIQRGYLYAGSQVLYAPTFGANRVKLEAFGLEARVAEMNRSLVALSKRACEGAAMVAGDLAPCGVFIAPFGDYTMAHLVEIYQEQAQAQEQAGVDLFAIETSMTLAEARAAFLGVRAVSDKPIFVTFTCDENGKTLSGADICAALVIFQAMGAAAFGLNCSGGPDQMRANIERLNPWARIPLIAKPNAGLPVVRDGETHYDLSAEDFARQTSSLGRAGASIFGGCCGTTEQHIYALARAVYAAAEPWEPSVGDTAKYLATEKALFNLADYPFSPSSIPCSPEMTDDLMDCEDALPIVAPKTAEDVAYIEESQYAAALPLCIQCDDPALLEAALTSYNGRAAVKSALPSAPLRELCSRFGAVIV